MTYCPLGIHLKYRKRWYVSLLCSEWEKVVPYRSNYQRITFFKNQCAPPKEDFDSLTREEKVNF